MLTGLGGRTGLRSAHVAYGTRGKNAGRPRRLAWALALAGAVAAPVPASAAAADQWEASSAWYQPSGYQATFVIAELHPDDARDSLSRLHGRTLPGPS